MIRVLNSDVLLIQFAKSVKGAEFKWGETDCASLVRKSLRIIYGHDVWGIIGHWSTEIGAARIVNKVGMDVDVGMRNTGAHIVERPYVKWGHVATDTIHQFGMVLPAGAFLGSDEQSNTVMITKLANVGNDFTFWSYDG